MGKAYRVHPVLSDDLNEGIIWIRDRELPKLGGQRRVVCISSEKKHIHSEVLHAEARYLERWLDNLDGRIPKVASAERKNRLENSHKELQTQLAESQKEVNDRSKGLPPLVFMSEWHRKRLGICEGGAPCTAVLSVKVPPSGLAAVCWQFRAGIEHPQVVAYLATALAIIGMGLGFIAIGLGLLAIPEHLWDPATGFFRAAGILFMLLGVILFAIGLVSVTQRARATTDQRNARGG
jgi:hypothetical protein